MSLGEVQGENRVSGTIAIPQSQNWDIFKRALPTIAPVSISLIVSVAAILTLPSDTRKTGPQISLGTHLSRMGHNVVGLRFNNNSGIQYFHYKTTNGMGEFQPVSHDKMMDFILEDGMNFETKNISLPQYVEAMGMISALIAQGPLQYKLFTNNCATTVAQVIRAAGIPIPANVSTPAELKNSFQYLR